MKKSLLMLAATACASMAHANGNPPTSPPPVVTPQPVHQGQAQGQIQGQAQGQKQITDLDIDAEARARSEAATYGTNSIDSKSKSSALFINFPQPVWTHVPGARGECIVTNSDAGSWGWSFRTSSESRQGTDAPCALEKMFVSAMNNCHFLSAEMIRNRNLAILTPGLPDLPLTPGVRNLTHVECEELRRPRLIMTGNITPPPVVVPPPAPIVQPAPVKPPPKRKIVPKKKLSDCAEQEVKQLICVPKKK